MDSSKYPLGNIAIIFILFAGVLYDIKTLKFPIDELELALEKASTPNKTVIIAVVNKAYAEQGVNTETTMLDLFVESFWLGEDTRPLLDHLLVVAVDQTAYERCLFKRLNCYKLETEGVDFGGEKVFMSRDFLKMMWRRTLLLLDVLKHGYNFIFTACKYFGAEVGRRHEGIVSLGGCHRDRTVNVPKVWKSRYWELGL
ncbi:unnamed protein product [Dovyalis caffra]|uniref:Nucleotide-diphospho-sugar transferase domain-containing protein n=1 Tax=Dovyalis caffra TaxID=77055 RepID=A0AAV1S8F9_9ROSI|nr:unnamed protein product [Dovyalis caffra]